MCVFSSHLFWTSNSLDVPGGVTQEEGHTGFLIHLPSAVRALIFLARRIPPFLSLVDREIEFWVTGDSIVLHLLGILRCWIINSFREQPISPSLSLPLSNTIILNYYVRRTGGGGGSGLREGTRNK